MLSRGTRHALFVMELWITWDNGIEMERILSYLQQFKQKIQVCDRSIGVEKWLMQKILPQCIQLYAVRFPAMMISSEECDKISEKGEFLI